MRSGERKGVSCRFERHARVTGRTGGLLGSRITAADDGEGLVSKDWDGTIADGTGGDTRLPVGLLSREVHSLRRGTGGEDEAGHRLT